MEGTEIDCGSGDQKSSMMTGMAFLRERGHAQSFEMSREQEQTGHPHIVELNYWFQLKLSLKGLITRMSTTIPKTALGTIIDSQKKLTSCKKKERNLMPPVILENRMQTDVKPYKARLFTKPRNWVALSF